MSAALRQWSLDDRLLAGDDPGTDPKLTERAAKLTRPQRRLELAQAFRHLLVDASRRRQVGPSRMSLRRNEILEAREHLLALADDLETREPTGVRGVILASRLLSQSDSPVYFRRADETVGDAARHARTALQLG